MRRMLCVATGVALVAAGGAFAQPNLNLSLTVTEGLGPHDPGALIHYQVNGILNVDGQDGLALWGGDLVFTDTNGVAVAIGDMSPPDGCAPGGMADFVKPLGLTNPAGYCGTVSANALLQVGGGTNTIGNTVDNAPYPIGSVPIGIALASTVLAEGEYTLGGEEDLRIALENCFANRLDTGGGPTVFPVTATTTNCPVSIDIDVEAAGLPVCCAQDINCDGQVTGLDIAVIRLGTNWQKTFAEAADKRADVNCDGQVTGLDIAAIRLGTVWQQLSPTGSQGAGDCECVAPATCPGADEQCTFP